MSNPFFSGRISQELLDHVEKYRESTGKTKTDVLVKALAAYTGFQLDSKSETTHSSSTLSEILERLEKLEAHVFETKAESKKSEAKERQYNLLDNLSHSNQGEILTTMEVMKKTNIASSTLSRWKQKGNFPKEHNNYLIEFSHSEEKPQNSFWRVTPI